MAEDVYDDAIVDVVGPENLISEPMVVKVPTSQSVCAKVERSVNALFRIFICAK